MQHVRVVQQKVPFSLPAPVQEAICADIDCPSCSPSMSCQRHLTHASAGSRVHEKGNNETVKTYIRFCQLIVSNVH